MRILITGKNSYIGRAVSKYLRSFNKGDEKKYDVDVISLRDPSYKDKSFAGYDTILHMVGKAHVDIGSVSREEKKEYYRINCDLAEEVAAKAKREGVKQFVYMSSVIVYGEMSKVGTPYLITADTPANPSNFYGNSKLMAELKLNKLADDNFKVALVRCPMVYGQDIGHNFRVLEKLAMALPVFPDIKNQRSMIYIENLTEFLRLLCESGEGGLFFPQDSECITTSNMVKMIAKHKGKKIIISPLLNPFVKLCAHMPGKIGGMANKAFGSLAVDKSLSDQRIKGYRRFTPEESIERCFKKK